MGRLRLLEHDRRRDPDWFLLTVTAYDSGVPGNSLGFYLADFRSPDNSLDYIVDDWTYVDLGGLGTADQLRFTFTSSDNDPTFGMNTPAYFALDNFQVAPEPSVPALVALGLAAALRRRVRRSAPAVLAAAVAALAAEAAAATITFEDLPLGIPAVDGSTEYNSTGTYYWNGRDGSGGFAREGLAFGTTYTLPYGSWAGFAYSNTIDTTTAGWGNQFSAITGSGADGSERYAICYQDTYVGTIPSITFSRRDLAGHGFLVTNTTYAALAMRDGYFGAKKFGGATGGDPDWFLLTVTAYDSGVPGNSLGFYLADFRSPDNSLDYIVDDWTYVDLGGLGTADQLRFTFTSSDNDPTFGMNTPAYFALDNFQVAPEPSVPALVALGLAAALRRRVRRSVPAVLAAVALGAAAHPVAAGPYSGALADPSNSFDAPVPGFVGPAGEGRARLPDSQGGFLNAANHLNPAIAAWATSYTNYQRSDEDGGFSNPALALGPVTGDISHVVSLGEVPAGSTAAPGTITVAFARPVSNKPGADLVVFENPLVAEYDTGGAGVGGVFAELAFVEVSSDGTNFARFPAVSLTPGPVGPYGTIDPSQVFNLAGKHANGYGESWGTPFDLGQLESHELVKSGAVDLSAIRYVRIVDIPGDGRHKDAAGNPIYDAWPTWDTGGFDLEAVGAVSIDQTFAQWADSHGLQGADREALADPDKDGTPNLLEFATGRMPLHADAFAPQVVTLGDGSRVLRFATRDSRATDVRLEVEASADLARWDMLASSERGGDWVRQDVPGAPVLTEKGAGSIEVIRTLEVPVADGPCFLRVRASLLP